MDGNGRWAKQRYLPRVFGHRAGINAVKKIVRACREKSIPFLTIFAFSSENWHRSPEEIQHLMALFLKSLHDEIKQLHQEGIQLRFIGNFELLDPKLRESIQLAQQLTCNNEQLTLVVALNYGGRWDITQAAKKIALDIERGIIKPEMIDEVFFNRYLSLKDVPEPDLFIRTSGEQRISNFLLWQLAYTELYFTNILWPDFDACAFDEALACYAERQRRFGYASEQVENKVTCLNNV